MQGTKKLLKEVSRLKQAINVSVPSAVGREVTNHAKNAQAEYHDSIYTGKNDVVVNPVKVRAGEWQIVASGTALLFIEFGTGITYTRSNPLEHPYNFAGSWSIEHGQYLTDSEKLAKYKGGWPLRHKVTYGNPSANVMYNTSRIVESTMAAVVESTIKGSAK